MNLPTSFGVKFSFEEAHEVQEKGLSRALEPTLCVLGYADSPPEPPPEGLNPLKPSTLDPRLLQLNKDPKVYDWSTSCHENSHLPLISHLDHPLLSDILLVVKYVGNLGLVSKAWAPFGKKIILGNPNGTLIGELTIYY